VEHFVSSQLVHFGVNKITGIIELCDFLGEKLHSQGRVTKNYGLLHMELAYKITFEKSRLRQ
jgi:hypothetical protein